MGSDKEESEENTGAVTCKIIMAAKDEEELGLGCSEDMMREIELLQLQEKRMRKLVDQRRKEREQLELENTRMQRQKKYMEEMAKENEDCEAEYLRQMASKGPFTGTGHMLGAPSPAPAPAPRRPVRQVKHVEVDTSKPMGSVQVRLGDGSRIVIKLNHHHTVGDMKQEIMAMKPEEDREFTLVSMGPPSKVLEDKAGLKDANLFGSAVMQRFVFIQTNLCMTADPKRLASLRPALSSSTLEGGPMLTKVNSLSSSGFMAMISCFISPTV